MFKPVPLRFGLLTTLILFTACGAEQASGRDPEPDPGMGGAGGARPSGSGGRGAGSGGATGSGGTTGNGGSPGAGGNPGGMGGSRPGVDGGAPVADGGSTPPPVPTPVDPGRMHPSDYVFDDTKLRTWAITIAPADLARLNQNILQEQYVPATVKVDGEDVGKVAVRYKGAYGTLQSCVQNGQIVCKKLSYKIDFAEYDDAKRFHGIKKINLHSLRADNTYLHERLAYKLFRQMGLIAPRSVHGKVTVNGEYKGVYAVTEAIDARYLDYHFAKGEGDGNLYKEAWPLSQDASYYTRLQKTNEMMRAPTKVVAAARELNAASGAALTTAVDKWMNLDYMLRFIAVDRAVTNWDGPLSFYAGGSSGMGSNHNYYLYEHPTKDRLYLLVWDLDNTFQVWSWWDAVGPWNATNPNCGQNMLVNGVNWLSRPACDRIFRGVAGAGRDKYVAALDMLLNGPFNVEKMRADLDAWAAQINDAVMMDVNGPGYTAWQANLATFKANLAIIREKMMAIRGGQDPRPYGMRIGGRTDFEAATPLGYAMGVTSGASTGSAVQHALNATGALGGRADMKLTFELRNANEDPAAAAWNQRAYTRFGFDAPTVSLASLRELRVRLKSDVARPVRIEVGGKYNTPPMGARSGRFGWDTMATPAGNVVTLTRDQLVFTKGSTSAGDQVGTVLSGATQLYFIAGPATRDGATGMMPAGTSEKGWLQIDDIEVVQ